MRKIFFIFFTIIIFGTVSAQNAQIDSLKILLDAAAGQEKVDILNQLAKAHWQIDPGISVEFGERSRKLAGQIKYTEGLAKANNNIGVAYFYLGDADTSLEYLQHSLHIYQQMENKQEAVTILNNIGIILNAINENEKAIEYFLKSLQIEEEIGNDKGIAGSLNNLGIMYKNQSKYNKALEYFLRSLQLYEKLEDKMGIASNYINIGVIYDDLTNYEKALESHLQALDIYEELNDDYGIAAALSNIGRIYDNLGNSEMALDYYLRALEIEEEIDQEYGVAGSLNNIGIIYDDLQEYEKAIEYYEKSLEIYKKINDLSGMADSYNNIGVAYRNLKNYKKALDNLLNSLEKYRELGRRKGIAAALNNVGTVYYNLENYSKAEQFLIEALDLAKQIETRDLIIEIYQRLSDVKVAQKNYQSALEFYKLYATVKDSIFSKERIEIITGMEATYEVQMLLEEREREIELLQKDNEIYRLEAEKKNLMMWLLYFGLAIVIALAFFVYSRYRLNKKTTLMLEKLVEERTRDLRKTNEKLTSEIKERKQLENQLIRSERLAGVGELAAGIAHEIRNPLGNISSSAQICLSKYKPHNQIKDFLEIIQEESEKANAIIKGLLDFANPREVVLKKGNICKVIEDVLTSLNARFQENDIITDLICPISTPAVLLDEKWLQQALQNLILNAVQAMPDGGKLKISAQPQFKEKKLIILIEDNGIGISKDKITKIFDPFYTTREDGVGLGLSLCYQIISDHNGSLQIESKENIGTKVILTFPIS